MGMERNKSRESGNALFKSSRKKAAFKKKTNDTIS